MTDRSSATGATGATAAAPLQLLTARLRLRPPVLADMAPSLQMLQAPLTTRYTGGTVPDAEAHWTKSLRDIGHWAHFGYGIFTVTDRHSGSFLGKVGLSHFARSLGAEFDPFPEASWMMVPHSHGSGMAYEAAAALHDWFTPRHPGRSVCIIDEDNIASMKLADRLGYQPFGRASYHGAQPVMLARPGWAQSEGLAQDERLA